MLVERTRQTLGPQVGNLFGYRQQRPLHSDHFFEHPQLHTQGLRLSDALERLPTAVTVHAMSQVCRIHVGLSELTLTQVHQYCMALPNSLSSEPPISASALCIAIFTPSVANTDLIRPSVACQ